MPFVTHFGSKQYIVEENQQFAVDRLNYEVGEVFDLPLLYSFGDVSAATPKAKVIAHVKGDKIRVVKFKSKSNYHKVKGFRPYLTILSVVGSDDSTTLSKPKEKSTSIKDNQSEDSK